MISSLPGLMFAAVLGNAPMPANLAEGLAAYNRTCRAAIESGDHDEAQRVCKRVSSNAEKLAPGSDAHVASLASMGDLKALVRNYVDADSLYTRALELVRENPDATIQAGAVLIEQLIEFKVRRGKYLDAEALAAQLLAIREIAAGPEDPVVAAVRVRHADMLSQSHQFPEAETAYKQAIAVLERSGTAHAANFALAVRNLGEMYERRAQLSQAEGEYRRLVGVVENHELGDEWLRDALSRLAYICELQDRKSEAASLMARAAGLRVSTGTAHVP